MSTTLKTEPRPRKRAARSLKAVKGSPIAGLEHLVGCVSIDIPPSAAERRARLHDHIRADHNT